MTKAVAKKNERWDEKDKERAVAAYLATGSTHRAADITGIPQQTISYWKQQEWFEEVANRLDRDDTDKIKSAATRIAVRASQLVEDRLENGEEVVSKDGTVSRRQVGAKDAALISAIFIDKRRQINHDKVVLPTLNTKDRLEALLRDFTQMAKTGTKLPIKDAEVIECPVLPDTREIISKNESPNPPPVSEPEASETKLGS